MKKQYVYLSSRYFRVLRISKAPDAERQIHVGNLFSAFDSGKIITTMNIDEAFVFNDTGSVTLKSVRDKLKELGYDTEVLLGSIHSSVISTGNPDGEFDGDDILCSYFAINATDKALMVLANIGGVDVNGNCVEGFKWVYANDDYTGVAPYHYRMGSVDLDKVENNNDIIASTIQCRRIYSQRNRYD